MRQPRPFYKQSHRAWYVERNGKQVCLVKGDKGETKQAAWDEYHKIMAGKLPVTDKTTVAEIVAQFLADVKSNKAAGTYQWYTKFLAKSPTKARVRRTFLDYIGDRRRVCDLKPSDVQFWLNERYAGVKPNYKNSAARAVATCFKWAADIEILDRNPVKGFKRPAPEPRDCYLMPEQWEQLIAAVDADDPFADLLWFLHETGARPQEARIVAAHHLDKSYPPRIVLERKNSKGKKTPREIYLNKRAYGIVCRLAVKHPDGPLFRNTRGMPWKVYALGCRFAKLRKTLGFKVFAYILRHTFITNSLLNGVPLLEVAQLAGHKDGTMIQQVYGHLERNKGHMAAAVRKATGEDSAA